MNYGLHGGSWTRHCRSAMLGVLMMVSAGCVGLRRESKPSTTTLLLIEGADIYTARGGDTVVLSTNQPIWWIIGNRTLARRWLGAEPPEPKE